MTSNTLSGARAVFMLNSVPVAFAGGVSAEESISYEAIDVLALLEVREHVPVAYTVSLNAQIFRVVGQSLRRLGIMPNQEDIITSGDMEAAIQDVVTRNTIALFTNVRCSGRSFDVTARGVVMENCPFVAIKMLDESQIPA